MENTNARNYISTKFTQAQSISCAFEKRPTVYNLSEFHAL